MRFLLTHPNFPSQLRSVAQVLAANPNNDVRFLTNTDNGEIAGVKKNHLPALALINHHPRSERQSNGGCAA